ncbi:MAG: hypothetical protein M0003_18395 [Acidithiobacillus sp.]|nr:hypothetical protein [Acidithiobacillus sp.]
MEGLFFIILGGDSSPMNVGQGYGDTGQPNWAKNIPKRSIQKSFYFCTLFKIIPAIPIQKPAKS